MRTTPSYSGGVDKDSYDLDHELNHQVIKFEELIAGIDCNSKTLNEVKVLLALQEIITKRLQHIL